MHALRVGIVGAGGITHQHAPSWKAVGADVAVHSLLGADALAAEFDLTVVPTLPELLDTVDVVDICTPTTTHSSLALEAIAAGVPVVCEKPLGSTFDEAVHVAEAAQQAQVRVLPAHVVRFFPQYARLYRAVSEGVIGRPAILRFIRGGSGPTSDWFFDDTLSGGVIMDLMIHDLDQARWLAGEVSSVYAVQSPPNDGHTIPRAVTTHATLTHQGGALSHALAYWAPSELNLGPTFDVAGTDGRLWTRPGMSTMREDLPGVDAPASGPPEAAMAENPFLTEIREFHAAVRHNEAARVDVLDGVAAVGLAEAARTSVRAGEPVDFGPYSRRIRELEEDHG